MREATRRTMGDHHLMSSKDKEKELTTYTNTQISKRILDQKDWHQRRGYKRTKDKDTKTKYGWWGPRKTTTKGTKPY